MMYQLICGLHTPLLPCRYFVGKYKKLPVNVFLYHEPVFFDFHPVVRAACCSELHRMKSVNPVLAL